MQSIVELKEHDCLINLGPVVQKVDDAIQQINHYPPDNTKDCVNTYPLDSDLSGG